MSGPDKEQLEIAARLAALMDHMAVASSKIDSAQATQVESMKQLAQVMGELNVREVVTGLNEVAKNVKELVDKMGQLGSTSQQAMGVIVQQGAKAESTVTGLNAKLNDTAADIKKINEAKLEQLLGGLEESNTFTGFLKDSFGKLNKHLVKNFPVGMGIAVGALSGLAQTFETTIALGKGLISFLGSVADSLINVGGAILSIPFKMFNGLIDIANKAAGGSNELMQAIEHLRGEFGALGQSAPKTIMSMAKDLKGFSDTGLTAFRVFGNVTERLEAFLKLSQEMGPLFQSFQKEFEDNGGALLAWQKGLGFTGEQMAAVAARAKTFGTSMSKHLLDVQKQAMDLGAEFNIASKHISRDMVKAMADVKHFGGATVKEMAQASVYARKLGLELDKIVGTLDAFETFDSAAENAAKLSQAFGMNVDAFKMMEAQDPAKQIDMLRKSMAAAGQDSSTMNRQQLKLLATTTGLDEATAKQAFSMKNQGMSLDQIKKKSEAAEKKQLSQAEAMSKLADSIERLVKSGGGHQGGFFDRFFHGILGGVQASAEFRSIIMGINRAMMMVEMAGVKLGRTIVKIFPGLSDFLGGIRDFFDPKKFGTMFNDITDELIKFFKGFSTGQYSFENLMESLQKKFFSFFDKSTGPGKKLLGGFTTMFGTITKIVGEAIKWMTKHVKEGVLLVTDLLSGKKKIEASFEGMGFVGQLFRPILEAFRDAWKQLKQPLKNLLEQVASMVWDYLKEKIWSGVKEHWFAIGMIMLGPALGRGILGGLTTSLGPKAIAGLGNVLAKTFPTVFGGLLKKSVESAAGEAIGSGITAGTQKGIQAAEAGLASAGAAPAKAGKLTKVGKVIASAVSGGAVAIAAAIVAIGVGAFALAKTSMKNDLEKIQDELNDEEFYNKLKDKSATYEDRVKTLREERLKHLKKATDEEGWGVVNWIRGGLSEQEADARAKMEHIDKMLAAEKLKKDRELIAGTPEYQKKMADAAAENKKRILDAMGPVTVENAAERFSKISELSKKMMGKDFDIAEKMKSMRAKLEGIDFTLFSDKVKEDQMNQALSTLTSVKALMGTIADVGALAAKSKDSLDKASSLKMIIENFAALVNGLYASMSSGDTGLGVELKKLSGSIELIAKDAEKVNKLGEIFKALADVAGSSKAFQQVSPAQQGQTVIAVGSMVAGISGAIESVRTMKEIDQAVILKLEGIKKLSDSFAEAIVAEGEMAKAVGVGGVKTSIKAAIDMVNIATDLSNAMNKLPNINIKEKLKVLAGNVGLGGKFNYEIKNKPIVMNVNFSVTVNAEDMEKALILRDKSIIRDRLTFATDAAPGTEKPPKLPNDLDSPVPVPWKQS